MPDFKFSCSPKEGKVIIESILKQGDYGFVSRINHENPKPPLYKEFAGPLEETLKINRYPYIVNKFTQWPPNVSEMKSGEYDGTYSIRLDYTLNLWSFAFPKYLQVGEYTRIIPANFYMPRCYYDKNHHPIKASDEVRALYADVLKLIKSHLKRVNIGGTTWIGPEALKLIQEGKGLVLRKGGWVDGTGKVVQKHEPHKGINLPPRLTLVDGELLPAEEAPKTKSQKNKLPPQP